MPWTQAGGLGKHQCKYDLHMLVCRLHVQENAMGGTYQEYWVERAIQVFKRLCKYKTTTCAGDRSREQHHAGVGAGALQVRLGQGSCCSRLLRQQG
jgi:hypothetical protein